MQNEIQVQVQEMTSVQIAEATGKAHTNVMRDIRKMAEKLNQLTSDSVDVEDIKKDYHRGDRTQYKYLSEKTQEVFLRQCDAMLDNGGYYIGMTTYADAKGENRPMYVLNGKAVLLLASGYNVVLRAKIIDKLEELSAERKASQPHSLSPERKAMLEEGMKQIISQYSRESEVHASLAWMQGMRDMMHLGRTAMTQMVREEGRRLGMPVPSVIPSESKELLSVTAIIKKWGLRGFKASEFNQKMIEAGAIAVRNGRKVLTGWGLDYGENRHSEHAPDVVWPVYYEDCFTYLCDRIGVDVNQHPF